MSNENTNHRFELQVIFEEDENAHITWSLEADERIEQTSAFNCEELTEAGAPLAALGIKVLHQLLAEQRIELALNKADNYRWWNLFQCMQDAEAAPVLLKDRELRLVH